MTEDIVTDDVLLRAVEEWLKSGQAEEGFEPGCITAPRLAELKDISGKQARKVLNRMVDEGAVRRDMISYVDGWGWNQQVKGYRLIDQEQ